MCSSDLCARRCYAACNEAKAAKEARAKQTTALAVNAVDRATPMSLAEAAALASSRHASGQRSSFATGNAPVEEEDDSKPKPKTLVEVKEELVAAEKHEKKGKGGKTEWEKDHPWKPWDRDTDLVVRERPEQHRLAWRTPSPPPAPRLPARTPSPHTSRARRCARRSRATSCSTTR